MKFSAPSLPRRVYYMCSGFVARYGMEYLDAREASQYAASSVTPVLATNAIEAMCVWSAKMLGLEVVDWHEFAGAEGERCIAVLSKCEIVLSRGDQVVDARIERSPEFHLIFHVGGGVTLQVAGDAPGGAPAFARLYEGQSEIEELALDVWRLGQGEGVDALQGNDRSAAVDVVAAQSGESSGMYVMSKADALDGRYHRVLPSPFDVSDYYRAWERIERTKAAAIKSASKLESCDE